MTKTTDSIKHTDKQRAHIPSQEEAGTEAANPTVQQRHASLALPKSPIIHRGQDPELFWLRKYGHDDREDLLSVDIRSLYRHEHIAPERLIDGLYKTVSPQSAQSELFSINELFGNALNYDELEKISGYYAQADGWINRLIQGDSLLVMASLLEREGMAGQVQTIYIDPPYGIKYNSNWQIKINDRNVKDGDDEHLSGEPEQIKAFRDTWELGIHSYLSYLRDRLLIARELLADSGSCFVQISDENVHLVRCIMDEVFGSENFVSLITVIKRSAQPDKFLSGITDYIIWYGKDKEITKYKQLFKSKEINNDKDFTTSDLTSSHFYSSQPFEYQGKTFTPGKRYWSTSENGLTRLAEKDRLLISGNTLRFKRLNTDFPYQLISNIWDDAIFNSFSDNKLYTVQTTTKVIQRCLLMTTDPGDLVLDPTCGSGTTAYVAEQWGRRWITIDTSRIALNIAKTRLMTAVFPYYQLHDEQAGIRQGFRYKTVPHITLKSLANDEPPEQETLYDQPLEDKKRLRVSGPFTVETLQHFEPIPPEALDEPASDDDFESCIFAHLQSAGIKNGLKNEHAVFSRVESLADAFLHAEGFYRDGTGHERKAYFHIGPKFGTVSKNAVNEAIKACRNRGDADWLVILGFSFESDIVTQNVTYPFGTFEMTKARMHDDLMQQGLLKKDKKAASFITIGEPDIALHRNGDSVQVEILGLDIYDPIQDQVKARNAQDIAYWMVDDDYDGNNFVVKQVFFCGGEKDQFNRWRKGLDDAVKQTTKRHAEKLLKIEIDEEAFDRLYGLLSHPFPVKPGQQVAVRVISQFGEESTKVLRLEK